MAEETTRPPASMNEKEAYFQALRAWVNQANGTSYFLYYLMASNLQAANAASRLPAASTAQQPAVRPATRISELFDPRRQEEIINANGGYEFTIAPLWKRLVAEIIDVFILFLIKLMITFALVDVFDLSLLDLDFAAFKSTFDEDYTEILSLTSELLVVEVVTRIIVCLYEAMWTAHGNAQLGGATPGKMLMGIRILYVEACVLQGDAAAMPQPRPLLNNNQPLKALLYPATNPGLKRALARAIGKTLFITFLFPICFVAFFYRNNRTIYDVLSKTIVVEEQVAPPLRRR